MKKILTVCIFLLGVVAQLDTLGQTTIIARQYRHSNVEEPNEPPIFVGDSTIIFPVLIRDSGMVRSDGNWIPCQVNRVFSKNLDSLGAYFLGEYGTWAARIFANSSQVVSITRNNAIHVQTGPSHYVLQRFNGSIIRRDVVPYDSVIARGLPVVPIAATTPVGKNWLFRTIQTRTNPDVMVSILVDSTFRRTLRTVVDTIEGPMFLFLHRQAIENKQTRILYSTNGATVKYHILDSVGRRITPNITLNAPAAALWGQNWLLSSPDGNGTYLFQSAINQGTLITRYDSLNQIIWQDTILMATNTPKLFVDGGFALLDPTGNRYIRYGADRREQFRVNLQMAAYGRETWNFYENTFTQNCFDRDGNAYVFGYSGVYDTTVPGNIAGSLFAVKISGFGREYTPSVPLSVEDRRALESERMRLVYTITPNPVRTRFILNGQADHDKTAITLIDMMGRAVRTQTLTGLEAMEVGDLPAGMYQYHLQPLTGQPLTQLTGKLLIR